MHPALKAVAAALMLVCIPLSAEAVELARPSASGRINSTAPATASPSPVAPTASPAANSPSPSPTPVPLIQAGKVTLYENYLGKILVHAAPREGYTVPIAELQRLGARTIGDVLRFVPGALVRQSGTAGSLQTVALRGNSASQTLIILDGRPVNEADTGVTDFTSMPLDGVQSISVIEGGLSSRYGSGAVGGVVEITTKQPSREPQDSAYAQVGYEGEFGSGVGLAARGAQGSIRVDAFTRYANNTFDYPSFDGIAGGTRTNSDLHASGVTLCACFTFGAGRRWGADLHIDNNSSEVGAPGSTQFGPAFVSAFARQQRYVQRNSLNLRYGTARALTTAIFYVDGRRLHFYDTTPSFPYDTLTLATQRGFSVTQTLETSLENMVTAKYEENGAVALFQGTIYTPAQLIARSSTTDAYLGDEYRSRGGTEIDAAAQVAQTQGTPGTALPSVAVSQQIGGYRGVNGTALRASYARSFRAPDLGELYFPGFGNPRLQPEYAATFDVGVLTSNEAVEGSATLFGSDTNDLIVNQAIDTIGDFLPFNIGRARVRGFDVQLSNTYSRRVGAQLSYTAYPVAEDLSTAPDINGVLTSGNRLLYRPTTTTAFEIWRRTGYDPRPGSGEDGLDLLVIGRQYADEENVHLLPPYATVGVHIVRDVGPHLALLLRIDNLTDERVPQVYGYPVLGTTFTVRLTAQ